MTTRLDLARAVFEADKAIDKLYAPLVPDIGASVRRHAVNGKITQEARTAILRDVDAMLDTIYGKRKGGPSALLTLITSRANLARMLPVEEAVDVMLKRLPDDLVKAMGGAE